MPINFNTKGFQIIDTDSVRGNLLVTVQSKTGKATRGTMSHLLSSIHRHLKKFSFDISNSSYNFVACVSQFLCLDQPESLVLPNGAMLSSSVLSHGLTSNCTQMPTAKENKTGSVQSCCCEDSDLLGREVLSLRLWFLTFQMNVLQRLFEP
jgi:hypothetical protein